MSACAFFHAPDENSSGCCTHSLMRGRVIVAGNSIATSYDHRATIYSGGGYHPGKEKYVYMVVCMCMYLCAHACVRVRICVHICCLCV